MELTHQIKAIYLADVVQQSTGMELRRNGNKLTGLCPLHHEKTPSFTVFEDNHFKCFGCGAHGDAVDFIQSLHGVDFKGALRLLGIESGSLSGADFEAIRKREQQRAQARKQKQREREIAYTLKKSAADGWKRETMELQLTKEDIQEGIEAYQARIQSARDKLATMPADASTYKEQKKLKAQRRTLQDDINHVYRLLAYAEAARLDCQE